VSEGFLFSFRADYYWLSRPATHIGSAQQLLTKQTTLCSIADWLARPSEVIAGPGRVGVLVWLAAVEIHAPSCGQFLGRSLVVKACLMPFPDVHNGLRPFQGEDQAGEMG
jgi:hypothetical protein